MIISPPSYIPLRAHKKLQLSKPPSLLPSCCRCLDGAKTRRPPGPTDGASLAHHQPSFPLQSQLYPHAGRPRSSTIGLHKRRPKVISTSEAAAAAADAANSSRREKMAARQGRRTGTLLWTFLLLLPRPERGDGGENNRTSIPYETTFSLAPMPRVPSSS